MPSKPTVPYEFSNSGMRAREEIERMLNNFGCDPVTFMERSEYSKEGKFHTLVLLFTFKRMNVRVNVSGQGWANFYLRRKPHTSRSHYNAEEYTQRALKQGSIAISSLLRDWVKSQLTLIETQIMSFEQAFLPHIQTPEGLTVGEILLNEDGMDLSEKLLALPGR